ncbi:MULTISPECIES: hemin-degrading factor [unclassified Myxococcus]|uniref:hemin-degrading factor n=1 Tax=unclassified Myxococcus TaxID=2648731 RepID=UPI00157A8AB0|nr:MULTISPECIES: ChuX/HutX family heme-like substrate-binding protein [unclassified Myxococcus]NTX05053.1 hemin-degrading factor [Myxococcus sp. CA040A]NTX15407.1 hemin-degrading factor [Myxococcus sp. CA056]NTX37839.1 hemin-degrading factor [Myxococcus sp. CA033]NTX52933.1 hemin-degrading factor [Myxococcus sp. CA039A]
MISQPVSPASSLEPTALRQRWQSLREEQPRTRIRDAAEQLGVSEAQLLATGVGEDVVRLDLRLDTLLPRLESLGKVMTLTRNESAVHEKRGLYRNVEVNGAVALVLDENIDLRLFLTRWRFGFAFREVRPEGTRRSLHFFDGTGMAVHKVYLEDESGVSAFERLVEDYTHAEQSRGVPVEAATAAEAPRPDGDIDVEGLVSGWRALQDTHDFFPLLRRFKVARTQALRLVGNELTTPVATSSLTWVLEKVAASGLPIMVFVGNPGAIQIHTGPVHTVRAMGPWMNVLDPSFNLHLRTDHVHTAWIVRKPTRDGVVTSLELFDAAGENIALLFGKRKPGIPEQPEWRALMEELIAALPATGVAS